MEGCECACKKIVCVDETSMCMLSKNWFVHLLSNHTWSALCGTHSNSYWIARYFLYLLRLKATTWLLRMLQFHHQDMHKYTINVTQDMTTFWVYHMWSFKFVKYKTSLNMIFSVIWYFRSLWYFLDGTPYE
jgi:hypothetical protein